MSKHHAMISLMPDTCIVRASGANSKGHALCYRFCIAPSYWIPEAGNPTH